MRIVRVIIAVFAACFLFQASAIAAEMPKAGDKAPVFTLKDQAENDVGLEVFRGKWVVLYFYPQDMSPGCSIQAHNFQRDILRYTERNAEVVGVSVDSPAAHRKFCADEELTFTLLSDEKGKVIDLYGSSGRKGLAGIANRNTFIIDSSGIIRKIYKDVNPAGHSAAVLQDLERLQSQRE